MKAICDIGLYRCDINQFRQDLKEAIKAAKENLRIRSLGVTEDRASRIYGLLEQRVENEYGVWPYNQTIGWLRIWVAPREIWGELFYVDKKRIDKTLKNKRFKWYGQVFSLRVSPEETSSTVADRLMTTLDDLSSRKPFKGRFLDLENLRNISPFMDWRQLITEQENPQQAPSV